MKTYGILLIGCGKIGMEHLDGIYYKDDVNIVAVIDTDIKKAREAAKRSGAQHYGTDYKPYLKMDEVDIVIIATYVDSHLEILNDCLAHGKHVLCEKPIASTFEQGQKFVDAVKASDCKVLVAHILRYNASYQLIKKLIADGEIGDVKVIRMAQNHHALDWPRYQRLMQDCSPTVDCGVHYYDVAEWLTGDRIVEVTGFGTKTQSDAPCENFTLVTYKMKNGCAGYYEVSWGETVRSYNLKEFIGTKGRITLDMRDRRVQDTEEGDLITLYRADTQSYHTYNVKALYKDMYAQLKALIAMIEGKQVEAPSIDDVWRALRIALTANKSIQNGKTEIIPE